MAHATIGMGEAAKLTGVSKSTLTRAVKAGKLSVGRDDSGAYRIAVAELERVYPIRTHQGERRTMAHHAPERDEGDEAGGASSDAVLHEQVAALQAQLDMMRDRLEDAHGERDDAREQRDAWQGEADQWRGQAETAQRLLADARPVRRGWFGLRSRA